jgi:hypothetical protein
MTTKQSKSGSAVGRAVVTRMDRAHEDVTAFEQDFLRRKADILRHATKKIGTLPRPMRFHLKVHPNMKVSATAGNLSYPLGKFR